MLETLKAALRRDVATPEGWKARYDLKAPDSKGRYLIRLQVENNLEDGDGWSATAEVDLRDLDPARLFTEQDSDGIDYLTIPTRSMHTSWSQRTTAAPNLERSGWISAPRQPHSSVWGLPRLDSFAGY